MDGAAFANGEQERLLGRHVGAGAHSQPVINRGPGSVFEIRRTLALALAENRRDDTGVVVGHVHADGFAAAKASAVEEC